MIASRALERLEAMLKRTEGIQVLALEADGSVTSNGKVVSLDDHPVHLAWLSQELFEDGSLTAFSRIVLASPELKWMQTVSAGLDHPMFAKLLERGVRLTNSDAQAPAIAEYVVGSVLYRYQDFPARVSAQQRGEWQGVPFRQLYGSRWLIVGFGNIGERVGRMARSFEARVTGVKRRPAVSDAADAIVTFDEMREHLPDADVVVISCALTDDTRDMVDADFLARLNERCVLVNIARGDIVDEAALLDVLNRGAIDYAVLDVFREEPLPFDSPFWQHERVHVTPHASNRGDATRPRGLELFVENLHAFLGDRPLRNEVDLTYFES